MYKVQETETRRLVVQVRRLQDHKVLLEGVSDDGVENRGTQVALQRDAKSMVLYVSLLLFMNESLVSSRADICLTQTGTQMGMEIDMSIYFLALAELRRHTPGVSQHLASAKNPSGIPLQDAYFTISFMTFPPTITVRSGEPVLDLPDDHPENKSRAIFRECQRSVGDRGDGLPAAYEVSSFLGGRRPTLLHHVFPSKIQLWAQGKKFDGDAEVDNVYRKPAKDDKGNNLAFVLDEIDRYVMDARKNFRPPAPGDEASPKTIYDYIEAKVTVDRDAMAWLGFKFYH